MSKDRLQPAPGLGVYNDSQEHPACTTTLKTHMKPRAAFSALGAFAVVVSACGAAPQATSAPTTGATAESSSPTVAAPKATGQDSSTTVVNGPAPTTVAGSATAPPAATSDPTTTAMAPPVPTRPRPDGEDAPDFTLALGQGGSLTLSAEQKPVYMVFWAEW